MGVYSLNYSKTIGKLDAVLNLDRLFLKPNRFSLIIGQLKSLDGWGTEEPRLVHFFYYKHEAGKSVRKFELMAKGESSGKGIQ